MTRLDAVKILGVKETATPEEIKVAYRAATTKWHPDKHGQDPAAQAAFRLVREAYDTLKNPPGEAAKGGGVPVWFMDLLERTAAKESREELAGLLGDSDRADAIQSALRVFLKMTKQKKTAQ